MAPMVDRGSREDQWHPDDAYWEDLFIQEEYLRDLASDNDPELPGSGTWCRDYELSQSTFA